MTAINQRRLIDGPHQAPPEGNQGGGAGNGAQGGNGGGGGAVNGQPNGGNQGGGQGGGQGGQQQNGQNQEASSNIQALGPEPFFPNTELLTFEFASTPSAGSSKSLDTSVPSTSTTSKPVSEVAIEDRVECMTLE
ncbi:hypothetical protein BGZ50_003981 [Haplosporangium sp. Z 11]|nr:hypothetical protein BGZ50_003981 [Haplosporangium sp. Z 11]